MTHYGKKKTIILITVQSLQSKKQLLSLHCLHKAIPYYFMSFVVVPQCSGSLTGIYNRPLLIESMNLNLLINSLFIKLVFPMKEG